MVFDDAGSLKTRYLHGPNVDQVFLSDDQWNEVFWALDDNQGTVRDVVDYDESTDTTSILNHRKYDAFGNITEQSDGNVEFAAGFTGKTFDFDSGLFYYNARWYDSIVGRFISEDPIGFAAGDANIQRYVGNNPTNFIDPTGFEAEANPGSFPTGIMPRVEQNLDYWYDNVGHFPGGRQSLEGDQFTDPRLQDFASANFTLMFLTLDMAGGPTGRAQRDAFDDALHEYRQMLNDQGVQNAENWMPSAADMAAIQARIAGNNVLLADREKAQAAANERHEARKRIAKRMKEMRALQAENRQFAKDIKECPPPFPDWIPVLGGAWKAAVDVDDDDWVGVAVNGGMAGADLSGVKAIGQGAAAGGFKFFGKGSVDDGLRGISRAGDEGYEAGRFWMRQPRKPVMRSDIVLSGGRGGGKVKHLIGPPNSVIRGSGDRIFITNGKGQVILDVTRARVKPVTPGVGFGPKRAPTAEELGFLKKCAGGGK